MKLLMAAAVFIAGCAHHPKGDQSLAPKLGESMASAGGNASKPAPVTPDDPRIMNVSAAISPSQLQRAQPATTVPAPTRDQATSSTPVQPPTSIAPASSTAPEQQNQPNVNSPPPTNP